jgi:hypothetical protein
MTLSEPNDADDQRSGAHGDGVESSSVASPSGVRSTIPVAKGERVVFPKTWRSEIDGLFFFAVFIAGGIALSINFPGSIITGPLFDVGAYRLSMSLPLYWLVPVWWLSTLLFRIYNVRYSADERGLEAVTGILSFSQTITRLRYEDVRSLELDQTLLERVLDVGELEIGTAGTAGIEMVFEGISEPFRVKTMIQDRREQEEGRAESDEEIMPRSSGMRA